MDSYQLVTPATAGQWASYHAIRREVLFEARGQFGVYNEAHPHETAPDNHPKLLLYRGDSVGVVRIDLQEQVAALRRVAIRADVQRRGHGRVLLELAQCFAQDAGCNRLVSCVALDAVPFYEGFGFCIVQERTLGACGSKSVFMAKHIPTFRPDPERFCK